MASSSLVLPSPFTKTLVFSKTRNSFLSVLPSTLSLASSLKTQNKPISISSSFSSERRFNSVSSRFVRNIAISSEFEQDEEFLSEGDERSYSPDLKLFVGNLPFGVDSAELAGLFERAGNVEMVEVIYDKTTGRSRGFGFVTMSTAKEVEAAKRHFDGYELEGRQLRVNSGPPPPKEDSSFRGSRGEGSFGGSNRGNRGGGSFGASNRVNRGATSFGASNRGNRGGASFGDSNWGNRGGASFGDSNRRNRGGASFGDSNRGNRGGANFGDSNRGNQGGASFGDSNRLHVSNLSWRVDDIALQTLFNEQGNVMEAKVVYDRESGKSRGFGFVTYNSAEEVDNAISSLNGVDLNGRPIRVTMAEAKPRRQF